MQRTHSLGDLQGHRVFSGSCYCTIEGQDQDVNGTGDTNCFCSSKAVPGLPPHLTTVHFAPLMGRAPSRTLRSTGLVLFA